MSPALRADLAQIGRSTAIRASSLATGFAVATLAYGMRVETGFVVTFVLAALAANAVIAAGLRWSGRGRPHG